MRTIYLATSVAVLSLTLVIASLPVEYRSVGVGLAQTANCSTSLQSLIDSAPAGSTLALPPCTYREQVTIPKPLVLDGQGRAEIRGSDVWRDWVRSGSGWISVMAVPPIPKGTDDPAFPSCTPGTNNLCFWNEQVFLDGVSLRKLAPGSNPGPGQFSLVSEADRRVRIGSDPGGRTVEVTTRTSWVVTAADDVTITRMKFRHAASAYNRDGGLSDGGRARFSVTNSELAYSHAIGIGTFGSGTRIVGNDIGYSGETGVGGGPSTNLLIQGNRIHDTNPDQEFNLWWDAAASKIAVAQTPQILDNEFDHNMAHGFWCDMRCSGASIARNRIHDNLGPGILYEVSSNAGIVDNTLWSNATTLQNWLFTAGIVLSSSNTVEVARNFVAWHQHSIAVVSQPRPDKPAKTTGISVHDNTLLQAQVDSTDWWRNAILSFAEDSNEGSDMYQPSAQVRGWSNRFWFDRAESAAGPVRFFYERGWPTLAAAQADGRGFSGTDRYMSNAEASSATAAARAPWLGAQPSGVPPATATSIPTATPTQTARPATSTPTPTPTQQSARATYSTRAAASPDPAMRGRSTSITTLVTSSSASTVLVDLEVYDGAGARVFQQFWDNQSFAGGESRSFAADWQVPASAATGAHTIAVGIFSPGWGTLYAWNGTAGSVTVAAATATPTPIRPTFTTSASVAPSTVARGQAETVTAAVSSNGAGSALVNIEIYSASGTRVFQQWFDNQSFAAGQTRTYRVSWSVPANATIGGYVVKIGVFSPGWGTLYAWNDQAATFSVT